MSVRKSIVSYIAAVKKNPRNSSREHTPIHDNSTSEQRENISIDLQSTQQSSSEIRESVVKKKIECQGFGLRNNVGSKK